MAETDKKDTSQSLKDDDETPSKGASQTLHKANSSTSQLLNGSGVSHDLGATAPINPNVMRRMSTKQQRRLSIISERSSRSNIEPVHLAVDLHKLTDEDLRLRGVTSGRRQVAQLVQARAYIFGMTCFQLLYMGFLVILIVAEDHLVLNISNSSLMAIEMDSQSMAALHALRAIEFTFICLFLVDLLLNAVAFGRLFCKCNQVGSASVLLLNLLLLSIPYVTGHDSFVVLRGLTTVVRVLFVTTRV